MFLSRAEFDTLFYIRNLEIERNILDLEKEFIPELPESVRLPSFGTKHGSFQKFRNQKWFITNFSERSTLKYPVSMCWNGPKGRNEPFLILERLE